MADEEKKFTEKEVQDRLNALAGEVRADVRKSFEAKLESERAEWKTRETALTGEIEKHKATVAERETALKAAEPLTTENAALKAQIAERDERDAFLANGVKPPEIKRFMAAVKAEGLHMEADKPLPVDKVVEKAKPLMPWAFVDPAKPPAGGAPGSGKPTGGGGDPNPLAFEQSRVPK